MCVSPSPASVVFFFVHNYWWGWRKKLAVAQTAILEAELAQDYCSHAHSPVQTLAFI